MKRLVIIGCVLIAIASMAAIVLRSHWMAESIRRRMVSEIERATGAHASLKDYSFSWTRFTVTLDGLTLRGAEPAAGPPLFHARRIRIRLEPHRLLTGTLRISSLRIDHPRVFLVAGADGFTNFPALQSNSHIDAADLIRLHVGAIVIRDGLIQLNDTRLPFSVDAQQLGFLAQYRRPLRQYDVNLGLKHIALSIQGRAQSLATLHLDGKLNARQLTVANLSLRLGSSSVSASGYVRNLSRPSVDLRTSATILAEDIGHASGISWLKTGVVALSGELHDDLASGASFTGSAEGSGITYRENGVQVAGASFTGKVFATPELIDVSQLTANALGGSALGDFQLLNLRTMKFRGAASHLDVRQVIGLIIEKPLPFTAAASGPVTLDTTVGERLTNTTIVADVKLEGAATGGNVSLVYRQDGNTVQFGPSKLNFPHSEVGFSGALNSSLHLDARTSSLQDLAPTLDWLGVSVPSQVQLGTNQPEATFVGDVQNSLEKPAVKGLLSVRDFSVSGTHWNAASADFEASETHLALRNASLTNAADHITAAGSTALRHWKITDTTPFSAKALFNSNGFSLLANTPFGRTIAFRAGNGSMNIDLAGTMRDLSGSTTIAIQDADVFHQPLTQLRASAAFSGTRVVLKAAHIRAGAAVATIQGDYKHAPAEWTQGHLHVRADTNRFGLQTVQALRSRLDGLTAEAEVHASGNFDVGPSGVAPLALDGKVNLRDIAVRSIRRGDLTIDAGTQGDLLTLGLAGTLEGSPVSGNLRARLADDDPSSGQIHFGKVGVATLLAIAGPDVKPDWDGSLSGDWTFHGPLRNRDAIQSRLVIGRLELRSTATLPGGVLPSDLTASNVGDIIVRTSGPTANIDQLKLATRDADLAVTGSVNLVSDALNLQALGSVDLRAAGIVDPDIHASGTADLSVDVGGVPQRPLIGGALSVHNASLAVPGFTESLTGISGTIRFDRTRAVIENLTGQSGGGAIRFGGVISFAGGLPTYNVSADAENVRFRYLRSSITGSAKLSLAGTTRNGLLSGTVTISRVVLEPGADLAAVFASASIPAATPVNQQDFLTGLSLDVHIQSTPDLQVVTSLSQDVQATIDLRLRGTREHPALLGQISANQGQVNIFGSRYTISRGNISFVNPVRIDPVLDLDLQTETRGITVDVIVSGTLNKLSLNYRSDPPLQAKEILALLTVGQTPEFAPEASNGRIQADTSALAAGASTILNQAISPASNRLSKLFGVTNVRIDPFVQQEFNNRQARLTLQEQVSRNITVTYVTNLAQTSEQIFRFEWSFNPQYSLVAVRDDNGEFGIDIQYKKRFK